MNLLKEINSCSLCADNLPLKPKPILQFNPKAKVLIVGQAPGIKAHESGIPWNDASGIRLREWLGLRSEDFYNPEFVAIIPMGFCYPGKGASGDLPPRMECSARWMDQLLSRLVNVQTIILVGQHSTVYFTGKGSMEKKIREYLEQQTFIVLPHPSPRNNIWLAKNKWFESEALPKIKKRMAYCLS